MKFLGEAKGIFNIITFLVLGLSIIFIFFGYMFFASGDMNKTLASVLAGLLLIINGAASIYYHRKRNGIDLFNNNMFFGFLFIIIGAITMVASNILITLMGIYLIVGGLLKINYGLFLKKFNESSWFLILVTGILFIVLAIITFFTDKEASVSVCGIAFLGYGLINLISTILLRRRSKYFIA